MKPRAHDALTAVRAQAASVLRAAPRLHEMRVLINRPLLAWIDWLLLFASATDRRPDLIVELGRSHGNSTCALTEAATVLGPCRVRSYGYDHEHAYERITVPTIGGLVSRDWLDHQEIIHKDITEESAAAMLGNAERVLLFWDAHGEQLAQHVLSRIFPALAEREHLIMVHDVYDTRYTAVSPEYITERGFLTRWQADLMSPHGEWVPIFDFVSRNRIRLDTPARSAHRGHAAAEPGGDPLEAALRQLVGPALDLCPSDSRPVMLAYFSCHDRDSAWPLVFPPPNVSELVTELGVPPPDPPPLEAGTTITLDLAGFAPHAGTTRPWAEGGIEVETAATPWAYAAALALPPEAAARRPAGRAYVSLRVEVERGLVGFGVLNAEGTQFLDRRGVGPSATVTEVFLAISSLSPGCAVVVQTWDRAVSAVARIESARLVIVDPPNP
jgi:hypothetical protein